MRTRAERRNNTYRKWISKLKNLYQYGYQGYIPIKSDKKDRYTLLLDRQCKSWDGLKTDLWGVMHKNTKTLYRYNKFYTKRDIRKKRLKDRHLSKADLDELERVIEEISNPFAFENYCGACDYFDTNECPFIQDFINGKYNFDTEWRSIKCDNFWD